MNISRVVLACAFLAIMFTADPVNAQFGNFFRDLFRPLANLFQPVTSGVRGLFGGNTINALRSEGRDPLFPADCGRDDEGKGKLCFGDPDLCRARTGMAGIHRFGGRNYYMSWQDSSSRVRNTKWDWFNARNYCRKRCMDLVSFETQQEYDWVKGFIDGSVPYFWTSGRKCNFGGCDKPEFFPKLINGWFWSANQVKMGPTNGQQFHDWSQTGG